MELISVVMSVYNETAEWLKKSIESILNQTYSNIEYIIVLDNPDNVKLEGVIKEYIKKDKRIKFIKNDLNRGLVYSLNRAIKEARGKYIARMDADDYSIEERLEVQYKCMLDNNVDFVMSNVDFLYEEEYVAGSNVPNLNSRQFSYMLKYGDVSVHPTWFFKREIFDEINGYREILYCEDLDFLLRAVQRGYSCFKMQEHLIHYRLRQNGVTKSNGLEQYIKAEKLRKAYKKGKAISEISVIYLEKCCEDIDQCKRRAYAKANKEIEQFVKALEEKMLINAITNFSRGIVGNKYYRILFFRAINYRIRYMLCAMEAK